VKLAALPEEMDAMLAGETLQADDPDPTVLLHRCQAMAAYVAHLTNVHSFIMRKLLRPT